MSTDFEREVATALRSAADEIPPPKLDPEQIRRGGKRRKTRALAGQALAAAIVLGAAGVTAAALQHGAQPGPESSARRLQPATGPMPTPARIKAEPPLLGPVPPPRTVRGFYTAYDQERAEGKATLRELIQGSVAPAFAPILEQSVLGGAGLTGCPPSGEPASWVYRPAGEAGGQLVTLVGPRLPAPGGQAINIVLSDPGTGMITGIACAITGQAVTPTGARNAATSLYLTYSDARHHAQSAPAALSRLLTSGSTTGDWYLQEAMNADANRPLAIDPVTCAAHGLPSAQAGAVKIVAGGSAALVVVTPAHAKPILITVVLSAKGWAPADIACQNP